MPNEPRIAASHTGRPMLIVRGGGGETMQALTVGGMDHLAIPVRSQERSRRFYETYFGFGARPARRYADGVLMLYDDGGFALALDIVEASGEPDDHSAER